MTNLNKLENQKSPRFQPTVKNKQKRSLVVGSIVATLIAITPYLFYTYESVPDEKIWSTFLFTFESHFYENANVAIWVLMMKGVPLYLLLIWFFTCRHWWYHVLLIPIAMYTFQVFSALNDETDFMDELHLFYLIPMMAVVIPSIYLVRAKMFNRITSQSMQDIEDEYRIGPRSVWEKVKEFF